MSSELKQKEIQVVEHPPLFQEMGLLDQFNLPPKVIRFIRRNQTAVWLAVGLVLISGVVFAGYTSYQEYRFAKAATALDMALQAETKSYEQLEAVNKDFASTPSALWAKVAMGKLDEKAGKIDAAMTRYKELQSTLAKESPLAPLVLGKLAALEEQSKNWDAALTYNKELVAMAGFETVAYGNMGRIYEQQGKKTEALQMYEKYLSQPAKQNQSAPGREMIKSRVALLKNL